MRQLLILGFYCEVYRREPRCRVYANDILLDEFDILHCPKTNETKKLPTIFDPKIEPRDLFILKSNSLFLKYIELDNKDLKTLDLKIQIHNDDNNYTNGFISKCSLIMLPYVFLLSKKILNNIDNIENNWKFSRKNYKINDKKSIMDYYKSGRSEVFNNLAIEMKLYFPGIPKKELDHWIGSSGYFHLTLKKKFGFWRHSTDLRKGRWRLGFWQIVEHFYNKYKQYEDQRSANT